MPENPKIANKKQKSTVRKLSAAKPALAKVSAATKPIKKATEKSGKISNVKLEFTEKVVRDSFTMPQSDYSKIDEIKLVCQKSGLHVKRSEILRAGLHLLEQLSVGQLKKSIAQIEQIKTGRPKMR